MESRHVQTEQLRVRYLVDGEGGDRVPVVLVHGFPQTSWEWRHQLPALAAAGHPVYAPDNRGFGGSDKPDGPIDRALLGDDLIRFLDALGLDRVALVGHDWGGIIAFKAAVDHPERFTHLGLLDTLCTVWSTLAQHGYWFKAAPLPEQLFADHAEDFIQVLFGGRDAAVLGTRPATPWPIPPGERPRPDWVDDESLAHYVEAFSDPASHRAAIEYYRHALAFHRVIPDPTAEHGERYEALSTEDVAAMWLHEGGIEAHPLYGEHFDYGPEDRHKRVQVPALWMYGSYLGRVPGDPSKQGDDRVPTGTPFLDQFSRYCPDLRVRRVASGHFIPEEAPEYTNETLLAFLAGRI